MSGVLLFALGFAANRILWLWLHRRERRIQRAEITALRNAAAFWRRHCEWQAAKMEPARHPFNEPTFFLGAMADSDVVEMLVNPSDGGRYG